MRWDEVPADATPFGVRGAELPHCSGGRSFHDAELADERFDAPEARGLDVIPRGLSLVTGSDEQMLAHGAPVYGGRCEYRRRSTTLAGEPG